MKEYPRTTIPVETRLSVEMDYYFGIHDPSTGLHLSQSLDEAAKRHGLNSGTVKSWANRYGWRARRDAIRKRLDINVSTAQVKTEQELNAEQMNRLSKLNAQFDEKLDAGEIDITGDLMLKSMNMEREILFGKKGKKDFESRYVEIMKVIGVRVEEPKEVVEAVDVEVLDDE